MSDDDRSRGEISEDENPNYWFGKGITGDGRRWSIEPSDRDATYPFVDGAVFEIAEDDE